MKLFIVVIGTLFSTSSFAVEENVKDKMCEEVYSSEIAECEEFIQNNNFEKIPVELCQYRISKGEMLTCYKAVANKTYKYDVILACASTH